jgi:hypothetical protein
MGRMYCINLTATAFTVAADLVEITPADDKPVIVHGFRVWQTTELGDTAEEVIPIGWVRGNATTGSGGNTSVAATPKNPGDAAAGMTVETANTTAATAGTAVTCYSTGWNVRAPLEVVFTPEQRIIATQAQTLLVLRLLAAPADSTTIGCSVDVEET